jgi:hypothetical protein
MSLRPRLGRILGGPPPVLPRPVDRVAERWAALPPRLRLLVALLALAGFVGSAEARISSAEARWGGPPVRVLVATTDLPVGAPPDALRRVRLPPATVPDDAVDDVPAGAALTAPLPAGAVLTAGHLRASGPAGGLDSALRALPVPVEDGWGVTAGGWVDVWVLDPAGGASQLVARSRPVLEVSEGAHSAVALVGLDVDEVQRATEGLALGRLVLAHAPVPAS